MNKESSADEKKAGDDVLVSWRPEDIEFHKEGMSNELDGMIDQAIFMGNMTDIYMNISGIRVRGQMAGRIFMQEGEKVSLRVDESNFRILAGDVK